MEGKKQVQVLGKIKSKKGPKPPPQQSRKPLPPHRTHQLLLKMSLPKRPNLGMEAKREPEVVEEHQVEDQKMWTPTPQGGTGTAPLKEEVVPLTIMESHPKEAEPVVDEEESSMGAAVVIVAPTLPQLDQLLVVGDE